MSNLSLEEKACNDDTWKHIHRVQYYLNGFAIDLIERGHKHDQSKLNQPEVKYFAELTHELAGLTYNSDEYKAALKKLEPALNHHYANNSHHPQFWKNGIDDMTLLDIVEMFFDWKAASERHDNGNINKSIEVNADRFKMSPQLVKIFENTAKLL
jgi:hypothetical protein